MKKLILVASLLFLAGAVFGQSFKKGSIVCVRVQTVELQPGVTIDQYIEFLTDKYYPAYEQTHPGLKAFVMKGIRGEYKDRVGIIFYFESIEIRDKYWPDDIGSTDLAKEALFKMGELNTEAGKYRAKLSLEVNDWMIQ